VSGERRPPCPPRRGPRSVYLRGGGGTGHRGPAGGAGDYPVHQPLTRFRQHVRASSKRRSREMAGRPSASWRQREPPSVVLPPARTRMRARWPSRARHLGPVSCSPRPRTTGDCRGGLGQSTPLLRGGRRSCGWRQRTRMPVTRMPRWRPRGAVPGTPLITTWLCEWQHDRRTAEAVRGRTRLVPSNPCGLGSSARDKHAPRPWCANGQRPAVACG
jgi:hypothetical protein